MNVQNRIGFHEMNVDKDPKSLDYRKQSILEQQILLLVSEFDWPTFTRMTIARRHLRADIYAHDTYAHDDCAYRHLRAHWEKDDKLFFS